jgi:hypothetical protein
MAPSAAEVTAPNATWTADQAMTAVTGRPGVYSGQPLPVFTGQAIRYEGVAPKLQYVTTPSLQRWDADLFRQEVFASAVRAGATNAGMTSASMPSVSIGVICILFWSIRRFWAA